MPISSRDDLTEIINVRGTFTPLGVSRASRSVCIAVSEALSNYFVLDELQDLASSKLSDWSGAEAAAITHCSAASLTISIAATMAGTSQAHIAALPDATGMSDRVILPAMHQVNYGHPITQAVRLAGAKPILVGTEADCSLEDLDQQIAGHNTCCLLLVSSKLVKNAALDFREAVDVARRHGVPTIIDGAAQDFRIHDLLATGADLVLVSAQKYLASPTAGLVIGKHSLVEAVRAQEKGIGRGMKATKEAILGVLAAIEERSDLDVSEWSRLQNNKVASFATRVAEIQGLTAQCEPDPTGLPFCRALLSVDPQLAGLDAPALVEGLKTGKPSIWVIDERAGRSQVAMELVQATEAEIETILARLSDLVSANGP